MHRNNNVLCVVQNQLNIANYNLIIIIYRLYANITDSAKIKSRFRLIRVTYINCEKLNLYISLIRVSLSIEIRLGAVIL